MAANKFGIRGGKYTDMGKMFLGAEILSGVGTNLYFNPNIEYVFVNNEDYATFNLDLHYDVLSSSSTYFWLGGRLGALWLPTAKILGNSKR